MDNFEDRIKVYDDIKETNLLNYIEHCNFFNVHAAGSTDPKDFQKSLMDLGAMVRDGVNDKALQKINGLISSYSLAFSGISPQCLAFAPLVKSIDGIEVKPELSNENLFDIIKELDSLGLTVNQMRKLLLEVKKKLETQITTFFEKTRSKADFGPLVAEKRIAGNTLDWILSLDSLEDVDLKDDDRRSNRVWYQEVNIPILFGSDHLAVKSDKDFIKVCNRLGATPKNLTIFEFYTLLELDYEKQAATTKSIPR